VYGGNVLNLSLAELLKVVPAILLGLTIHELAHAFMALRLGDDTPKQLGRLTINPLKHIDIVGFILLLIAGFGWAKPVVINKDNLKKPFRDDILIAVSGPVSNLIVAVFLVVLLKSVLVIVPFHSKGSYDLVVSVFLVFISINLSLGLFNLLPIPPLDGSHVVWNLLSKKSAASAAVYFQYGSYALLALILLERVTKIDLLPIGRLVSSMVMVLLRLVALV
jgi:Zn-dependent protease